jgi:hypothetical protein
MLHLARRASRAPLRPVVGALLVVGCALAGTGCGGGFSDADYEEIHYDDTTDAVLERLGNPDVVNDEYEEHGYVQWFYFSEGIEYRLGFLEGKMEDRYDDPCLDEDCSAEKLAAQD